MEYRLDKTVGFAIYKVAMRLRAELTQRLRGHDLTSEQYGILARLWEEDGICQRELAERIVKDRPNVTRMLDKLERKGLVSRRPDPADRRAYGVYLTEEGRAIQAELMPIVEGLRSDAYQGIGGDEQDRVRDIMDRIFRNLGQA